jgi:hypothetical protein
VKCTDENIERITDYMAAHDLKGADVERAVVALKGAGELELVQ